MAEPSFTVVREREQWLVVGPMAGDATSGTSTFW